MSHTQTIKILVKDKLAFRETCSNDNELVGWSDQDSDHTLFDGTSANGMYVHFKGWSYPVIFTKDGEAKYDNYEGRWGSQARLNKFTQQYSACAARNAGLRDGFAHLGTTEQNGNIVVRMAKDDAEVQMTFPEEGDARFEVNGCSGPACQLLTAGVSAAVGVVTGTQLKDEYHDRERLREREV